VAERGREKEVLMSCAGRVSKIVYACACPIFLLHCLRRLPVSIHICKKVGWYVYPVASSLAINEATHIEWLHKKGVVEGCRCRRPIAKTLNTRTQISSKIACRLISASFSLFVWGSPTHPTPSLYHPQYTFHIALFDHQDVDLIVTLL